MWGRTRLVGSHTDRMTDTPASEPERRKGDPMSLGIASIVMGLLMDIVVVIIALIAKQPLYLLVTLLSIYGLYNGVKYIRIGLRAKSDHD